MSSKSIARAEYFAVVWAKSWKRPRLIMGATNAPAASAPRRLRLPRRVIVPINYASRQSHGVRAGTNVLVGYSSRPHNGPRWQTGSAAFVVIAEKFGRPTKRRPIIWLEGHASSCPKLRLQPWLEVSSIRTGVGVARPRRRSWAGMRHDQDRRADVESAQGRDAGAPIGLMMGVDSEENLHS